MRYIVLFGLLSLLGCQSQYDRILGVWTVNELSEYPLSISNYGDITFNKSSKALFENGKLTILGEDSREEIFSYRLEGGNLIILYSDFGIPLEIKQLTKTKLILEGGGFGNSEIERSRDFRLILSK